MLGSAQQQNNRLVDKARARLRNSLLVRYPDLGMICLGVFVMLIGVGAVVPIRQIYARDHGATPYELGLMASGFMLGTFLVQMPGGWLSDRWGRKPLLVFGIAMAGVISFAFLLWDYPWYFIALRFIEGVSGGAIIPAANAYVMDTVPARERGVAFGWLGSAFSAGLMLGPAVGGVMVDTIGYSSPFIFGGVTSLLTALFLLLKMRNYKPGTRPSDSPDFSEDKGSAAEVARAARIVPASLFRPALFSALVLVCASGVEDGLFNSLWALWLNDLHASNSFIGLTFITFSLPLMILMPITGKWADKRRLTPMIAIPAALASGIYLVYGLTNNLVLIAAMGLIEGSLLAIRLPAMSTYIANLSPDTARGRMQGITSTARTIVGFASSMVVVLLYAVDVHYPFFMLAGTQIVVSTVGGLMIWRIERRTIAANAEKASAPTPVSPSVRPLQPSGAGLDTAAK